MSLYDKVDFVEYLFFKIVTLTLGLRSRTRSRTRSGFRFGHRLYSGKRKNRISATSAWKTRTNRSHGNHAPVPKIDKTSLVISSQRTSTFSGSVSNTGFVSAKSSTCHYTIYKQNILIGSINERVIYYKLIMNI